MKLPLNVSEQAPSGKRAHTSMMTSHIGDDVSMTIQIVHRMIRQPVEYRCDGWTDFLQARRRRDVDYNALNREDC